MNNNNKSTVPQYSLPKTVFDKGDKVIAFIRSDSNVIKQAIEDSISGDDRSQFIDLYKLEYDTLRKLRTKDVDVTYLFGIEDNTDIAHVILNKFSNNKDKSDVPFNFLIYSKNCNFAIPITDHLIKVYINSIRSGNVDNIENFISEMTPRDSTVGKTGIDYVSLGLINLYLEACIIKHY